MTEYHYCYKIEFETGHVYFGVRSCKCLPEDDVKYLESIETRGISFVEEGMRWRLTYAVDKKRARNKYFKRWVDAAAYRSQLESDGCTFLIQCKNWKKKLEEKLSNTQI